MSDNPYASRRGCEWDDFGESISLIVVKAPAKDVAAALSAKYNGKIEAVDPYATGDAHPDISNVVFQHAGHAFSVFATTDQSENFASDLSKALKTRLLCLMHEDTSGWTEYRAFDAGRNVETYTFGADYADEMETMAEEMGEDFQMNADDHGNTWDHRIKEDETDYLFRSELRKVKADTITDSTAMLNDAFVAADAWLPGWSHFPWGDATKSSGKDKPQFDSALRIKVR
jgi:hypothetical protein